MPRAQTPPSCPAVTHIALVRVLGLIVIIAGLTTPWFGVARVGGYSTFR
jgi:hypothetical protein